MTALQACLNYLDVNEIRYTHTTHPVAYTAKEVAAAEFMPAHRIAKTVVFSDGNGYLLVVVPADTYVDIEQVRAAVGSRELRKAIEDEVLEIFPQAEVGSMPPLTALARVPVYLDRALADQEFIAFTAGTHRDVVHMKTADFRHLSQPVIGEFSRPDLWEEDLAAGF
ncbi:MAG TPA: YbaK/EbsC family protein [Bryobacteraceae bacterium]|nr:YbaK/EbsC family protein [Bryobacteraceae bacterium]